MPNSRLANIKNVIWSVLIVISLASILVGLGIAVFNRYEGTDEFTMELTTANVKADKEQPDASSELIGNARGELHVLSEVPDAGEAYIDKITFLVDSTFIGFKNYSLVDESKVWITKSGSLPVGSVSTALIVYPGDGSELSAANAAMVKRPEILFIGIGTDGLAETDEDTFITQYDALINDIRLASPDTLIVCSSLASIIEGYSGNDSLTVTMVSDANDWIKLVCRDTGAYYLDIAEVLDESVQLLFRYASSNGKTLNTSGLNEVLMYLRTHALAVN